MRPKRRRSRPKGSKTGPPPAGRQRTETEPGSERGQPTAPPAAPPAPEPAAPPEPVPDPRVGDLETQVSQLTQKLEGLAKPEGGNVDERFQGMEDRMKSLLQLSEILSVRYNPFLEEEEPALYDDHAPEQFLPDAPGMAGPGSRPPTARKRVKASPRDSAVPAGAEVVPMEPDPDVPMGPANVAHADDVDAALEVLGPPEAPVIDEVVEADSKAKPSRILRGASEAAPPAAPVPAAPPQPSAIPPQAEPAAPPDAEGSGPAVARPPWPTSVEAVIPVAVPTTERPRDRAAPPRSAYFALCWFERLAAAGDPSEIHLFLDHYERLGWIPNEDRSWMRQLALGIAPPRSDLSWDDLGLTGPDLARLHRDHLRFLEKLFRTGLADDSPEAWERQADHVLGGR